MILTLQEKVAVADVPRFGDNSLDSEQLLNPLSNFLSTRNRVQVCTRVRCLLFDPSPCSRRVLIFQPAIGICNLHTMQSLRDGFRLGRRGCDYDRRHVLPSRTCWSTEVAVWEMGQAPHLNLAMHAPYIRSPSPSQKLFSCKKSRSPPFGTSDSPSTAWILAQGRTC